MLRAVYSVLSIMIMLSIGWVLAYKGWIDDKITTIFAKILITVALPSLLLSEVTGSFDRDKLISSGTGLFIGCVTIILSYGIGIIVAKVFKIEYKRRGIFQMMFAFSNTMFIGLPVNLALFGEESVPYVLLYYLANTTLFWTMGVYGVRKHSIVQNGKEVLKREVTLRDSVRKIFSPPLISFFVSIFLIMLEIKLPGFITDPLKYMGSLCTPMSMLFIGAVVYSMGFRNIKFDRDLGLLLAGRFIITPLIVVLILPLFSVPDLLGKVFIIQSAMPVVTQSAVTTKVYGGDYRYASTAVTVSTIASLIFLPLYMYLLG